MFYGVRSHDDHSPPEMGGQTGWGQKCCRHYLFSPPPPFFPHRQQFLILRKSGVGLRHSRTSTNYDLYIGAIATGDPASHLATEKRAACLPGH
jgi:hypothetical protein